MTVSGDPGTRGRAESAGADGDGVRIHLNRLDEWEELRELEGPVRRAARRALSTAGSDLQGEISLTCLPVDEMARMNEEYLGREGPTDVIAFPLEGGPGLLGDVYLCPEMARRAAREEGIGTEEEIVRLTVHGVLHVMGHEHPEDGDRWASKMYRLQERIVEETLG